MIHRSHCNIKKIHHHPYSLCTVKYNLILYCQLLATIPKQQLTPTAKCFCNISKYIILVIGHEAVSMHNLGTATYSLHYTFNCCTQVSAHEHAHTTFLPIVRETSSVSLAWKVFHRKPAAQDLKQHSLRG
jgi:hypothetical protein